MWAFFSKRLRMWLILAVGVPVVGWLVGKVADVLEARRGPGGFSSTLRKASGWMNRRAKGPLAHRRAAAADLEDRPVADPAGARDPGTPAR